MTLTAEELEIIEKAKKLAEANPEIDLGNSEWEKRAKDNQASFTKAQQDKIEMAKLLVEQNPANVEKIPDEKVRNKVLQEKWGVDNLEELKVLFPDYAKPKSDNDDDDNVSEIEIMRKEIALMKYQNSKTKTKEALDNIVSANKELIAMIPDFEEKMREELKSISESLDANERVKKAFRLVAGSIGSAVDAYGIIQGISTNKSSKTEIDEVALLKEQNEYRKLLGLKTK